MFVKLKSETDYESTISCYSHFIHSPQKTTKNLKFTIEIISYTTALKTTAPFPMELKMESWEDLKSFLMLKHLNTHTGKYLT
jgi:hypothetical protein